MAPQELAALAARALTTPAGELGSPILAVLVASGRLVPHAARELLASLEPAGDASQAGSLAGFDARPDPYASGAPPRLDSWASGVAPGAARHPLSSGSVPSLDPRASGARPALDPRASGGRPALSGSRPALDPPRSAAPALPGRHDGHTIAAPAGLAWGDTPGDAFGSSPRANDAPDAFGSSPRANGDSSAGPPPSDERTIAATPTPGESGRRRAELLGSVLLSSEDPAQRYVAIAGAPADVVLDRRLQRAVRRVEAGPEDPTLREARLLARLDHPALPRVHELDQGGRYATLDVLDGTSLVDLPVDPAGPELRAFLAVVSAVRHAHGRGLVHGALGPRQVVLGDHGCAWVTGWARASLLEEADAALRAVGEPSPVGAAGGGGDPRAPELKEGGAPRPPADVWGLGLVLHWLLARDGPGPRGAPRLPADVPSDLAHIAAKALAPLPRKRYARVAELEEDVRRFLDGRAVGAVRDTPLRALRRLVRTQPVPTLVAALALAAVVVGGAVTLAQVRARYALALEQRARATEARGRAEVSAREAEAALDEARGREGLGDLRLRFERALAGHAPDGLSRATELLDRLERDGRAPGAPKLDATFLRARLLRARAAAALHERPRPADALRDAEALATLLERVAAGAPPARADALFDEASLARAQLAEAQLMRFLAARRLPGRAAQETEVRALEALAGLGPDAGALARWARLELRVRPIEGSAELLLARRPPSVVPDTADMAALRGELRALCEERPDLAQAHELEGRLLTALCAPDLHRSQLPMPNHFYGAFRAFFRATYLDPLDPTPRNLYLREWNAKFGQHFPWRWIGGWSLDNALWASTQVPRIEPTLEVVDQLQRMGRVASTLPLLERVLGEEPGLPRDADPHARALLAHARARLASGLRVEPAELERISPPPGWEGDKRALLGWALMLEGDLQGGFRSVAGALQVPGSRVVFQHDLLAALTDPRVEPRGLVPLLAPQVPPAEAGQDDQPLVGMLLLARALAMTRAGFDAGGDLARLEPLQRGLTRDHALFQLARALREARLAPDRPGGHLLALYTWAETNLDVGCTEEEAALARDVIVERLRGLGLGDAARAFEAVDAVDEVWVRRFWIPPAADLPQGWRTRRDR